jgi:hypothetical protein
MMGERRAVASPDTDREIPGEAARSRLPKGRRVNGHSLSRV